MTSFEITTWSREDRVLLIEALATWAGPPVGCTPREARAYELIELIAAAEGVSASTLLKNTPTKQ